MRDFEENRKLIYAAINSLFGNELFARKIANKHHMEFADFEQIGAEALYKCCMRFEEDGEGTFANYAIVSIKKTIQAECRRRGELVRRPENKQREIKHSYDSLDRSVMEDGKEKPVYEYIPTNTNVEKHVIKKITFEEMMNSLKDVEREVLLMKLNGDSEKDIANTIGKSVRAVQSITNRALRKINPNYEKQTKNQMVEFTELFSKGTSKEEIMKQLEITNKAYTNYKYRYNKSQGA
jgi:RNA polymerase sigma factor (sigma-70 family)